MSGKPPPYHPGDAKDKGKDDKPAAAVDWFYCSKCDKTLPLDEEIEHNDMHFAEELQSQEDSATTARQVQAQASHAAPHQDVSYTTHPSSYHTIQSGDSRPAYRHRNQVTDAADIRARDEQEMQNALQNLQLQYRIFNPEIDPEHDFEGWCPCAIHQYQRRKWQRMGVQKMWYKAVMYPGERPYVDWTGMGMAPGRQPLFNSNPYNPSRVMSPYGYSNRMLWTTNVIYRPQPKYHERFIHDTMRINASENRQAQAHIDDNEPKQNIWAEDDLGNSVSNLTISEKGNRKASSSKEAALADRPEKSEKQSKFSNFRKSLGIKTSSERETAFVHSLRQEILHEEAGRWPVSEWRDIASNYQDKLGIKDKVSLLRQRYPIQYLHLLRAGYFEPIPVAWAYSISNPLKFSIEPAGGWPGITPQWRGYEDTAEERLYWVLNHRGSGNASRLKPDFISVMNMAMSRMASAVEPPPQYFSANDTCHVEHTSAGYSKQVMPPPFVPHDRPETALDDTMILLDISGSMDFDPMRPIYDRYLVTDYARSTQPKNRAVAKAIVKRFTDAMINHDHLGAGYDLVTFSSQSTHAGTINHRNFDQIWSRIRFGGGTRVMTGWQKVKDLHFQKHSESAIHHPVFGWQAGPETPMLRLLLLLDGEATDMDEFELDLLGLSWAHVTIFLIGVDGCPHHHRHANELQRISDVNPHVAFVDAQGNMPERFVTHELLKRHLGYDISMHEFEEMEQPPPYVE